MITSQLLRDAVDLLSAGDLRVGEEFICHAICEAAWAKGGFVVLEMLEKCDYHEHLREGGLDDLSGSLGFSDSPMPGVEVRQAIRFMYLEFLACMLEDEENVSPDAASE